MLNGQIMPGDVDRFRFEAEKGDKLVMVVLRPRIGARTWPTRCPAGSRRRWRSTTRTIAKWPMPTTTSFVPIRCCTTAFPQDGSYELEIRDSIYRGREDFVYRITARGNSVSDPASFRWACRPGSPERSNCTAGICPWIRCTFDATEKEPGSYPISVENRKYTFQPRSSFAVDALPELVEQEPNNDLAHRTAARSRRPSSTAASTSRATGMSIGSMVVRAAR